MRRYIILLLITGAVWAQTDFDKMVLLNDNIDGSINKVEYLGEYLKMNHNLTKIYFKPQGTSEGQPVPIKLLHTLQLKDGRVLIHKGSIRAKTFFNSLEYEKLTIEQKAVYDELRKRHKRQIITYSVIILILSPFVFIGLVESGLSSSNSGSSNGKGFTGYGP